MSDDPIKAALRMMPYGFYSITSKHGDDENAMVANWITQVSFEPRLIALGLQKTSHTHSIVEKGRAFAVNIFLAKDEQAIKGVTKSTSKNPDKMKEASYSHTPEIGAPLLDGAAAYLEVKVREIYDIGGDHDIVVGEVINAAVLKEGEPSEVLSLPKMGWSYAG